MLHFSSRRRIRTMRSLHCIVSLILIRKQWRRLRFLMRQRVPQLFHLINRDCHVFLELDSFWTRSVTLAGVWSFVLTRYLGSNGGGHHRLIRIYFDSVCSYDWGLQLGWVYCVWALVHAMKFLSFFHERLRQGKLSRVPVDCSSGLRALVGHGWIGVAFFLHWIASPSYHKIKQR